MTARSASLAAEVSALEAELLAAPRGRTMGGIRCRISRRLRQARLKLAQSVATHTRAEWLALISAHPFCAACRAPFSFKVHPTKDHVIPLSSNGHDGISNIQPLCGSCNARKGARLQ